MSERFKIIGIPASEIVIGGKHWCQVHCRWEDVTECTKCEEEICQMTFEQNQGLCDKCYKKSRLMKGVLSTR